MEGFASGAGTGSSRRFVYLNDFKFKMLAKDEDIEKYPELVSKRTKKMGINAGEEVTELGTNAIVGHVIEIIRREVPYQSETGHEFNISLKDSSGTIYQIALKDQHRQATYILTRLPNVDLSKPIKLGVFKSELLKNGQPYPEPVYNAQVYIQQQTETGTWATVKNAFPPETASEHGMPEFEQAKVGAKTVWDNSKQYAWLIEQVALPSQAKITAIQSEATASNSTGLDAIQTPPSKPKAEPKPKTKKEEPKVDPNTAEHLGSEYEDDDLPF